MTAKLSGVSSKESISTSDGSKVPAVSPAPTNDPSIVGVLAAVAAAAFATPLLLTTS